MPLGAISDYRGKGITTTKGLVVDGGPISRQYGLDLTIVISYRLTIYPDTSEDLKVALSKEYSNSMNFSNSEIFLKLR